MKKYLLTCAALALSVLLTACSTESVRTYTADDRNVPEKEFSLRQSPDESVSFELLQVPCPPNANVGPFCAYGPDIYYVVDYIDYVTPHTGVSAVDEVTEEYYTQIFHYNTESGDCSCIYTSGGLFELNSLSCNAERLIWTEKDCKSEEAWEIKRALLKDGALSVDTVLKSSQSEGTYSDVVPSPSGDSLFFYEFTEYDASVPTHPVFLYEFNLETGSLEKFKTELDCASPYEDIPSRVNRITYYRFGLENALNTIYVDELNSGTDYVLETAVDVCNPAANDRYCIWRETYDATPEHFLYYFNFDSGELHYVSMTDSIFSYELIGRFAFLSESDSAIWCLDLEKEEMVPLVTGETYRFGYLGLQEDNTIYAELAHSENSFTLFKISVSE